MRICPIYVVGNELPVDEYFPDGFRVVSETRQHAHWEKVGHGGENIHGCHRNVATLQVVDVMGDGE